MLYPCISVIILPEFTEQQPAHWSPHTCPPNLTIFCPLTGEVWCRIVRIGEDYQRQPVKQRWWSAVETRSEESGDGSLLKPWIFPEDQHNFGPKFTERELNLIAKQGN